MSVEGLQAACMQLKSTKSTERKKAAEAIREMIQIHDELCRSLDSNSMHKDKDRDKITWNSLFSDVKEYFSKETEKITTKDVGNFSKSVCFSTVDLVIRKATCHRPWISWTRIVDFIISHLQHDVHSIVFGKNLVSMLQNFLTIELYASILDAASWIDIIKILLGLFHANNDIPDFMVLQCLNIAIQEGSRHPGVIPILRSDVVNVFQTAFSWERSRIRSHIVLLLRGVTVLSSTCGVEFRGILCKLGESIIPSIIQTSFFVMEEEEAIVEFLYIQLQLHSPCDVSCKSDAFYADDQKKWAEMMKNTYAFCLDLIQDKAMKKKFDPRDVDVSDRLILLAAKCTKQVCDGYFEDHLSSGDEDEPNPSKKAMRFRSFSSVLQDVCSRMPPGEPQIVWMTYITATLTQFPSLVGSHLNYGILMGMGLNLLQSVYVNRCELYRYFICLLHTETYLLQAEPNKFKSRSKSWEVVWDVTLRSLQNNQSKNEAMELLRKLMVQVQPPNLNNLLSLYVQGSASIPVSAASLYLLSEFLANCSLPFLIGSSESCSRITGLEFAASSCPRSKLIRWIITSRWESDVINLEPLAASILIALVVRQTHNLLSLEYASLKSEKSWLKTSVLNDFYVRHEDFEKLIVRCSFVPPVACEVPELCINQLPSLKRTDSKFSLLPRVPGHLIEALQEDFDNLPSLKHTHAEFLQRFQRLNFRVGVYLNALNILEKYSIGLDTGMGFRSTLEKLFDAAISKSLDAVVELSSLERGKYTPTDVMEVIHAMRSWLRPGHLTDKSKSLITQRFSLHVQDFMKKVYRSNLSRYIEKTGNNSIPSDSVMFGDTHDSLMRLLYSSSGGADEPLSENRQIELASLEALGCLVDFGSLCDHRMEVFKDLLTDCLLEGFTTAIPFIFDFTCELITQLTNIMSKNYTSLHSELMTLITTLVQKMCKGGFYQIPQCAQKLWEVLAGLTPLVAKDNETTKKNLMNLVGVLCTFLKTNTAYGSSIAVSDSAFKTLQLLAQSDREILWTYHSPKTGPTYWILGDIYEFLSNPSFKIRMLAGEVVTTVYEYAVPPPLCMQKDNRLEYFEKIYATLQKTFSIPVTLSSHEKAEEGVNRTAVALTVLTKITFAYPFIQKRSSFAIMDLVKTKGMDVNLANKALMFASKNAASTMSCHVSYLLAEWFRSGYSVDDIPYMYFGCKTPVEFNDQFRREVSVELFQKGDMSNLQKFADACSIQKIDLIKECYGMLMARIVPVMSVFKVKGQGPPQDIHEKQEMHKSLSASLGGKRQAEEVMMTSLPDVLLQLVSLVYNPLIPSEWACPSFLQLPSPSPPFYDEEAVDISINFLKESSSRKDMSIVAFLASHNPKSIYEMLLTLVQRIHSAHDVLEKFWRLHQFSYFVKQLYSEPSIVFNHMKEYVCQFVVYAYLRLLKLACEDSEDSLGKHLRQALIHLISQLVLNLTLSYMDEMKFFYHSIVNGLVCAVRKYPELIEAAKKPLDCLVKTFKEDYTECIITLAPFPKEISAFEEYREIFKELKYGKRETSWPLHVELKACLNEIEVNGGRCNKERLETLRDLLSKRKRDLEKLVRNLEGKRFSDECTHDVLHRVIKVLIDVAKDKKADESERLEASRCLGEIGPVDLTIMVLPGAVYGTNRFGGVGGVNSLASVLKLLVEYLMNEDISVVTQCGQVLRSMCHMRACLDLVTQAFGNTRMDALLKPFKPPPSIDWHSLPHSIEKVFPNLLETKLGLNEMNEFSDFGDWIKNLTYGMIECFKIDDSLTAKLLPMCRLRVDFCQQVLSLVFHTVLFSGRSNPIVRKTVSGYFRNFFTKFVQHQSTVLESSRSYTPVGNSTSQSSIYCNKMALRALLGVVQYLRNQDAPQEFKGSVKLTPFDSNFWLELNYLDLARAAQYCGAYLTSILYTEIAATDVDMGGTNHIEDVCDEDPMDSFYSQGTNLVPRSRIGESFEKILLKAYTSIGEPDAVYGCGSARFSDPSMAIRHLQRRMQWSRVLSISDGTSGDADSSSELGVCSAMKELGLYNTLWTYLQGVEAREKSLSNDLAAVQYECGWRLSKWTLNCDKATYVKSQTVRVNMLDKFIYSGVQSGLEGDTVSHVQNLKEGYDIISRELRHASIESSENLLSFLSQFQIVRIVEDFFQAVPDSVEEFLHKWKAYDRISMGDFKFQEPSLFLRSVLLRSYGEKCPRADLDANLDDIMLELLGKSRDTGRLDFAENCATLISGAVGNTERLARKELEIAKNHWARADQDIARYILGRFLKKSSPETCELYPVLLLTYGEWLSETMSERPSVILEKYLLRSCQIYEKKREETNKLEISKAHFVLAKYADSQYQNVVKYMKSDLYAEKCENLDKAKADLDSLRNVQEIEVKRSMSTLRKQANIDEEEIKQTAEDRNKFLILALTHYLKALKESNDQDLLIFRAVALWLDNSDPKNEMLASQVNALFEKEKLPSYKYIVVLHQLSARLNENSAALTDKLKKILKDCANEHPYHTLPVLLTQALLQKDQELNRASKFKKQLEDRVKAASKLVDLIKKDKNRSLGALVAKMEHLWVALINFANTAERSNTMTLSCPIPNDQPIKKLKGLETVAVPTASIPLSITGEYKDSVIGIKSFEDSYSLVGGINSPKRIACIGTNGIKFNMLLKGQDDLRQDAVMQQVFGVMNKLLNTDTKTKNRRLVVRTYKVVPLSQRTGVLEWCENTQTFGDYLVSSVHGAHQKYRPNDYAPQECRQKMHSIKDCGDNDKKYSNFMTIMEHFKPVFRHFFFENFKEPGTFFERRLAYTRSVATNSMVGYILGLGDRHVLNILIDKTTAEFIHIDLGVAFEQGRILPTPETIPFRLTRDVVDGMGISGVEGVFRKSCEMTLEVLRNHAEIILTILEVLLYDPLYMWTLTADRMRKVQPLEANSNRSSTSRRPTNGAASTQQDTAAEDGPKARNSSAARVLLRLRQKLAGVEEGGSAGSVLSVPGHVALLIQRAMDPERLSRLFSGWQPYL